MEDAGLSAAPPFGALTAEPAHAAPGGMTRELLEEPHTFDFYQAVRLLERERGARAPVGGFGDPAAEVARFQANPSLGFPTAEISAAGSEAGRTWLRTNVFGLDGPSGVLPFEYTMLVIERMRAKDHALREFLDLFNHRALSLLYRAWAKSHFVVGYERDGGDDLTRHLMELVGLGTAGVRGRLPVPDEAMLLYAGLLAGEARPAVALEQLVADFFGVPARVEQFLGAWYPVESETQCRLGDRLDETTALGLGALAGDEIWDQQSRVRIRLGPMRRDAYDRFLPGGPDFEALRGIARFFARDEVDFELQLVLSKDDVPPATLDDGPIPLGWSTWLRSRPHEPFDRDADETVFTL